MRIFFGMAQFLKAFLHWNVWNLGTWADSRANFLGSYALYQKYPKVVSNVSKLSLDLIKHVLKSISRFEKTTISLS